jgi:hypothetical protein
VQLRQIRCRLQRSSEQRHTAPLPALHAAFSSTATFFTARFCAWQIELRSAMGVTCLGTVHLQQQIE